MSEYQPITPHCLDLVRARFALWPVLHYGAMGAAERFQHSVLRGFTATTIEQMQHAYQEVSKLEHKPTRRLVVFAAGIDVLMQEELQWAEHSTYLPGTTQIDPHAQLNSELIESAQNVIMCLQSERNHFHANGLASIKNRRDLDQARRAMTICVAQRFGMSVSDVVANRLTAASRVVLEQGLFPYASTVVASLRELSSSHQVTQSPKQRPRHLRV